MSKDSQDMVGEERTLLGTDSEDFDPSDGASSNGLLDEPAQGEASLESDDAALADEPVSGDEGLATAADHEVSPTDPTGDVTDTDAPDESLLDSDEASTEAAELPAEGADKATMGHWLAVGLQPSHSKSVPPAVVTPPAPQTPETLAPQVLASSELDAEDLAVLPKHGQRGSGKLILVGLGLLAAVMLFGYGWRKGGESSESAASLGVSESTPSRSQAAARGTQSSETPVDSSAGITETKAGRRGLWQAPMAEEEHADADAPWGPSVGRLPDLPPEVWSRLRKKERMQAQSGNAQPNVEIELEADSKPALPAPVVPAPTVAAPVMPVPAPTIPAPVVQAPVVPAPVVQAPVIPAPVIPAPTVAAPVVPAPVIPAPTVPAPVLPPQQ